MNIELQERFIAELLEGIQQDWTEINLTFEYFTWKGNTYKKFLAKGFNGSESFQYHLSLEALDLLVELNKQMSEDGKEAWSWLVFTLNDSGKYDFDFKYGIPPMTEEMLRNAGEM